MLLFPESAARICIKCLVRKKGTNLPVISGIDQPGAVTSRRVEVGVVWRTEGAIEVPQPFSTSGNVTVYLITKILEDMT